jgi:hypothetical protein
MQHAQALWSHGDAISVLGSAGVGAEGGCRRGGGSGFTSGNGGTVFWWLGCWRVVKKLLGSFYGMMWCCWCPWLGLRAGGSTGRRRGRAAAEARAHRRSGPVVPVHESEIGQAGEHQWVAAVF